MSPTLRTHVLLTTLLLTSTASADPKVAPASCPGPVTASVAKRFPGATISSCKAEHEKGHDQFEVKITSDHGNAEIDVSPDGKILVVEEVVAMETIPAVVMKAFGLKYPKAKPTRAEKQTPAEGAITYEIAFLVADKRHEATFTNDGAFVEEE